MAAIFDSNVPTGDMVQHLELGAEAGAGSSFVYRKPYGIAKSRKAGK